MHFCSWSMSWPNIFQWTAWLHWSSSAFSSTHWPLFSLPFQITSISQILAAANETLCLMRAHLGPFSGAHSWSSTPPCKLRWFRSGLLYKQVLGLHTIKHSGREEEHIFSFQGCHVHPCSRLVRENLTINHVQACLMRACSVAFPWVVNTSHGAKRHRTCSFSMRSLQPLLFAAIWRRAGNS